MNGPEFERKMDDEDLRKLAELPEFRRFLWTLLERRCGTFSSTFAGADTHRAAFNEGRRAVGLELVAFAKRVAPQDWLHMQAEASSQKRIDAAERAKPKE